MRSLVGEESVSTDDKILLAHGFSEWSNHNIDRLPIAVVYPRSTEECAEMVKVCYKYKIPISM
jgi:D-lactate dehydrogenase (cytochrome)